MKLAALLWLVPLGLAVASAQAPAIAIVEPTSSAVLVGSTPFVVQLQPSATRVTSVTITVDGRDACKFTAPPFSCTWDAGTSTASRTVRVVAELPDGSRLVQAMRTRAVELSFSSSTDAVLVSVHVTDSRGRPVHNLDKNAFVLAEDGMPQEIRTLYSEDESAHVVLALDVSGSMAPAVKDLQAAARRFLGALRPKDSITLVTFNTAISVLAAANADPAARLAAIDGLKPSGSTAIYDAIIRCISQVKGASVRKAIVVFTDGEDVASRSNAAAVRAALQTDDVVLYVVAQGVAASNLALREQLKTLTSETGGAAFFSSHMSDLGDQFVEIVRDLSSQYVLAYSPTLPLGDGRWRKIQVEARGERERYQVRAREGYLGVKRIK